jgi:hypothetical protein
MHKMTALILFASIASPAAASDWRSVGSNVSGSKYSIDASTVARSGDTVTVWVKTEYGKPSENGVTGYKARREIKCPTAMFRDLQTVYFRGDVVSSTSGAEDPRAAAPDSIAESVVQAACKL